MPLHLRLFGAALLALAVYTLASFELLLPLHIIGSLVSVFIVIIADIYGLRWIIGRTPTLSAQHLLWLHEAIFACLFIMIVSGILLALPKYDSLIVQGSFWVKQLLVLALVINGTLIGTIMKIATTRPFAELSLRERRPLFLSGAVSTICWIGVFVTSLFFVQ